MPRMKNGMKAPRFSSVELKVQAIARRQANNQLLRVPWSRFRRAYEEYPRWQALALWSEAVSGTEGHAPSSVLAAVKKRCPGFLGGSARSQHPEPLALRLLEWVHTQRFGYAKQQGWLDALIFYGVRHPLSRGAWAYWEYCEKEWNRKRPASLPSFERWWRLAMEWELFDRTDSSAVATAVEGYVRWEALVLWLRPLFSVDLNMPSHVLTDLRRKYPEVSRFNRPSAAEAPPQPRSSTWQRICNWGKEHFLSQAREAGWADSLLEQARCHPWHVRTHAFAARWTKEWIVSHSLPYPSLREWERAAARSVKLGGPPGSCFGSSPKPSAHTF